MIAWSEIDTKGRTRGQIKVKCPACINRRTNKRDTSLSVNLDTGVAKCHYCNEKSFREPGKVNYMNRNYNIPEQNWKNYTALSEETVRFFEGRRINQSTLINNRVTEELIFQPSVDKEIPSIVFNYFEGETLVNKKYRTLNKKFTQSPGTKNIFYGLNDIAGNYTNTHRSPLQRNRFGKICKYKALPVRTGYQRQLFTIWLYAS